MNKQSENTKQVGVLQNFWDEEFWLGVSEKFSKKQGDYSYSQGDTPSDRERRQPVE